MKNIQKILLTLSTTTCAIMAMHTPLTPKNCVIVTDADDVIIQPTYFQKVHLIVGGAWIKPLNTHKWLQSLYTINQKYTRDANGIKEALCDENGNAINGLTFHFLYHATQNNTIADYVPWIVNTMEHSQCYIDDTKKIYQYLKNEKGYTIIIATNKDRPSYDATNNTLNLNTIATKSFVAHPGNNKVILEQLKWYGEQMDIPENYKQLLDYAITVQPSHNIYHAPSKKPHREYYSYIHETIGHDKNIVFIDDKEENIDGFNKLKDETSAQLHGIHFKNPAQLADEFVQLGILSEINDKQLLDEVRYSGIITTLKMQTKKLVNTFFS